MNREDFEKELLELGFRPNEDKSKYVLNDTKVLGKYAFQITTEVNSKGYFIRYFPRAHVHYGWENKWDKERCTSVKAILTELFTYYCL